MEGRNGTGGGRWIGRLCVSIWCCSWVEVDYDQDCGSGDEGSMDVSRGKRVLLLLLLLEVACR